MLTGRRNGSNWYLLQCKPRQDERAEFNLLQQGYATFRPQLISDRIVRGKPHKVVESLFPGYLFIQLSGDDNWGPIRSTRGVSRIVEFNHVPAIVNDQVIEHLRVRNATSLESSPANTLEPGHTLHIIAGPLAPFEGVCLSMLGAERVMMLLQFLNRQQPVRVPLGLLERQRQ